MRSDLLPKISKVSLLSALGLIILHFILGIILILLKEIPFYDEAVYMNIARNVVEKGLPYRESVPEILWFWHPPLARYISACPVSFV